MTWNCSVQMCKCSSTVHPRDEHPTNQAPHSRGWMPLNASRASCRPHFVKAGRQRAALPPPPGAGHCTRRRDSLVICMQGRRTHTQPHNHKPRVFVVDVDVSCSLVRVCMLEANRGRAVPAPREQGIASAEFLRSRASVSLTLANWNTYSERVSESVKKPKSVKVRVITNIVSSSCVNLIWNNNRT